MKIQNVTDASFRKYGKIITEYSFEKILKEMEHTPLPKDVVYVPSVEELEVLPEAAEICKKGFGGLPIQIGYCNGDNHKLNALEYHRSSELDIAQTDLILLLGMQQDIEDVEGRLNVSFEDIKELAYPVLRHRIILNFDAITEGLNEEAIISKILEDLKVV